MHASSVVQGPCLASESLFCQNFCPLVLVKEEWRGLFLDALFFTSVFITWFLENGLWHLLQEQRSVQPKLSRKQGHLVLLCPSTSVHDWKFPILLLPHRHPLEFVTFFSSWLGSLFWHVLHLHFRVHDVPLILTQEHLELSGSSHAVRSLYLRLSATSTGTTFYHGHVRITSHWLI